MFEDALQEGVGDGRGTWLTATHWSLVLRAGHGADGERQAALATLCETYRYPVYAFIRRHGRGREDAEDLTQGFFLKLLSHNWPGTADPEKGRFRSLLLTSLKRYLADEWDRTRAKKRGEGRETVSLDAPPEEARYLNEPADIRTPDALFERRWALETLEAALRRLELECQAAGKSALFEAMKPFLTLSAAEGTLAEAGSTIGLTEGAAKMAVHRLRQRYREVLRESVAHTLADPTQVDDELRALRQALRVERTSP